MFPGHKVFGQSICDSIDFNTDSIYLNQLVDDSIEIRFDYEWALNPSVAYPSYKIVLDDTSQLVFRDEFLGTFLGQQTSISFEASYKNQNIPTSYQTSGSFDVHDPNSTPTLICQFPIFISFERPSGINAASTALENKAYPNPCSNVLHLKGFKAKQGFTIFTSAGQVCKRGQLSNEADIDVRNLQNGLYILQLESGFQSSFSKF
jgi:hypothetical protein